MLTSEQRAAYVKAEMQDYSDGCYADHGSAKDQINRFAQTIESAATAPLLARIAELERQLEEARKDAERWNWLNWHIGVAWGEEGFTSLIRIVSEKHRALINTQIDKLMSGELPETPAIRAAIKEQT